jgi:release factor glutamine methyltransferase
LAAENPAAEVTLADVSPEALELSAENAQALGISNIRLVESDLFSGLGDRAFNLIVANLPYVPEADKDTLAKELAHDPALALFGGSDGMEVIRRFIPVAASRLLPGGWLALEIGIDQAAETESLLRGAGLQEIRTIKDISGVARFPVARRA